MKNKQKRVEVELPKGTPIEIDGDVHKLESGKLVIERDFLYAADDPPGEPTESIEQYKFECELWRPDED